MTRVDQLGYSSRTLHRWQAPFSFFSNNRATAIQARARTISALSRNPSGGFPIIFIVATTTNQDQQPPSAINHDSSYFQSSPLVACSALISLSNNSHDSGKISDSRPPLPWNSETNPHRARRYCNTVPRCPDAIPSRLQFLTRRLV
jgi:hypothetical protein